MTRNETNQMWRRYKSQQKSAAQRREEARFNAIRRAAKEGRCVIVRTLGPHGVRLASPSRDFEVDYWPGRGTMMVVDGRRRSRSGVSVAAVLRKIERADDG